MNMMRRLFDMFRDRYKASSDNVNSINLSPGNKVPLYRRYLCDKKDDPEAYLQAARDYVNNQRDGEKSWLYCKPYDRTPGNNTFFIEMYQMMNLLKAMNLPYGGRILEVGSGSGWITEILVSLGFEVHGLEPSDQMINIAHERIMSAIDHWKINPPPKFKLFCETLEECTLPSGEYDGILFYASLHHIIDECLGIAQCFRLLRPGGVMGICEGAWEPGNSELEATLEEAMNRFGTLENPFTQDYLDYLLRMHGFVEIERYHGINGFVPQSLGKASIEALAQIPSHSSNNLTTRKPMLQGPTTRDHTAQTRASIVVEHIERKEPGSNQIIVRLLLANTGNTVWLHESTTTGMVTVAVRSDPLNDKNFLELPRQKLPHNVFPGEHLSLDLDLHLPDTYYDVTWYVDLVNEGLFWFSTRGTDPVNLIIPEP